MHSLWTWMRHNPGDLATWASALGTFLAFLAVVIPLGLARRAERRSKLRAQAEGIAAWFEAPPPRNASEAAAQPGTPYLVLRNATTLPVYEVAVDFRALEPSKPMKEGETIDEALIERVLWIELLPPGEWLVRQYLNPESLMVGIRFVDAAGRFWIRSHTFRLEQLPQPPLASHGIDPSHHPRAAIVRRPT